MGEWMSSVFIQPSHRAVLPETTWEQLREPGAYVELATGMLYRVPVEAINSTSPASTAQDPEASRLVKLSSNPFLTTLDARMLCAELNINPKF